MENERNISEWVETSVDRPGEAEFRQAVYVILTAIHSTSMLRDMMVMKGGILMAIQYRSARFTTDIDFSAKETLREVDVDQFHKEFDRALISAAVDSEYDMECRIQSCKVRPSKRPEATFPSINLTIGYARKGAKDHKNLLKKRAQRVVAIDFSLNESILSVEHLTSWGEGGIQVYGFTDLVAEKIRALLQQPTRKRNRRQDVYDLYILLGRVVSDNEKNEILESLQKKAQSRNLSPDCNTLSDPEVRRRAELEYHTLADEVVGKLPDFGLAFVRLEKFYRSLPWEK